MDFKSYIKSSALEVEEELNSILGDWKLKVGKVSSKLVKFTDFFIDASQGGKRLRGVLVKLGYEMGSNPSTLQDFNTDILKPAAAFEIFQTAILAHDDVIDLSPIRRGKPTIFKALGGDHYAISQTISIGDIGLFLAAKLICDSNFADDKKNKALSFFLKNVMDTGLGEILDVELPRLKETPKEGDIITIFKLKTAYYTIIGPLTLGAILAGAPKTLLDQIYDFGLNLGIAFQIQDDILGVFGDEEITGKSVTSDIEEGKNTLLMSFALQNADVKQKQMLKKYYGNGKIDQEVLEVIRRVFIESGALEYSRQQANQYVKIAKRVIPQITRDPKMQKLLSGMADFLIDREK